MLFGGGVEGATVDGGGEMTDAEELTFLRSIYKRERILKSVKSITRLEDDIDEPLKTCVMALALLGCEPVWSCCGFDYAGQPIHKSHEHGRCGIRLRDNDKTVWLVEQFQNNLPMYQRYANHWYFTKGTEHSREFYSLLCDIERGNAWPDRDGIHYSEPGVISIAVLESWLWGWEEHFSTKAVLKDSNSEYQHRFYHWQYPPKADWVIRKSAVMKRFEKVVQK